MKFEDCPICLEQMEDADHQHPIQCGNHCGFNFCKSCIESFISSSQDDYMEASDGSQQVKVWLHCPSCRSNLTYSIRDTLLLRKVDSLRSKIKLQKRQYKQEITIDIEYNESEQRLKDALETSEDVQRAVEESRKREEIYLKEDPRIVDQRLLDPTSSIREQDDEDTFGDDSIEEENSWSMSSYMDEWGVEADLQFGIHNSFRMPRPAPAPPKRTLTPILVENSQADKTLFYGLDQFLSEEDRRYLTGKMVSGKQSGLAEAAEIMAQVSKSLRDNPTDMPQSFIPTSIQPPQKRSSIFALVAEVDAVHQQEDKDKVPKRTPVGISSRQSILRARLQRRESMVLLAQDQKSFPLPVRLPKYVECSANVLAQNFTLLDHEWDGTVLDAFSKITIGFGNRVRQTPSNHTGAMKILGGTEARVELPGQPRVLLANVHRTVGQQGVTRGDVLTHINGDCISGQTVIQVLKVIQKIVKQESRTNGTVSLVFNAERSVAEGLRRRAMAKAGLNR